MKTIIDREGFFTIGEGKGMPRAYLTYQSYFGAYETGQPLLLHYYSGNSYAFGEDYIEIEATDWRCDFIPFGGWPQAKPATSLAGAVCNIEVGDGDTVVIDIFLVGKKESAIHAVFPNPLAGAKLRYHSRHYGDVYVISFAAMLGLPTETGYHELGWKP
jgi:hypothetical protein